MPKRLLIANWKLNKTITEARAFANALRELAVLPAAEVEVAIAPPLTSLYALTHEGIGDLVSLCAQRAGPEQAGAYTGDVSPELVRDAGARYALVGHSEARSRLGEDEPRIRATLSACWQSQVTPVLCVGEPSAERERDGGRACLARQVEAALAGQEAPTGELVVAYEPVWAIGTARPAEPALIATAVARVRALVATHAGAAVLGRTRFLYGGGVRLADVASLVALAGVDGLLVGKASLDARALGDMVVAMGKSA